MTTSKIETNPLFSQELIYQLPYSGRILRDLPYGGAGQHMDIYYPEQTPKAVPVVILVTGYPDPGFKAMTGLQLKDVAQNQSWARLLAASGVAVITYTAAEPVQDLLTLVDCLPEQGIAPELDAKRLAVLSVSGNVPNALHLLQQRRQLRCAALCYGFMLDNVAGTDVAAAAEQFRFVNPNTTNIDLSPELALLIVRAGQDSFPGVNSSIDRFVAAALAANRDMELINYPQGVHAFEIQDGSTHAQQIVRRILMFFQQRLLN